tara:strand:+ start:16627 stop:16812 length:186 start_codon:yes stop_codon:yes gene_type:complete
MKLNKTGFTILTDTEIKARFTELRNNLEWVSIKYGLEKDATLTKIESEIDDIELLINMMKG